MNSVAPSRCRLADQSFEQLPPDAAAARTGEDGQVPQLHIDTSRCGGDEPADKAVAFFGDQFNLLARDVKLAPHLARQPERLPEDSPEQFVQA